MAGGTVARAHTLKTPASRLVISSHHRQLPRRGSPNNRASLHSPSPTLTSTRAMAAAPDQATPRIARSPR